MHTESSISQAALPEHFPTVITEVAACEGIADIDIDLWQVSERLTAKGLTPEQIDETTILISAKKIQRGTVITSGRYDDATKTVMLFPILNTRRYTQKYHDAVSDEQIAKEYRSGPKFLGWTLDWTLQHELEHRVVHAEGGMHEEERHKARRDNKMMAASCGAVMGGIVSIGAKEAYAPSRSILELGATVLVLGGVWFAGGDKANTTIARRAYRNSPEEARARAAESDDPRDSFFTIRLAYQDLPMRNASV